MSDFVINEWLWADANGRNGKSAQLQALQFVEALIGSVHRIVVLEGSEFDRKAWALCRSSDTIVAAIARLYVTGVRQNLERCLILDAAAVPPLPDEIAALIKPDDQYLARTQAHVPESTIITTDGPLRKILLGIDRPCVDRDSFLKLNFGI